MQQVRRGRAEHRARHRAAPAGAADHHIGAALGRCGQDRLPRLALAAGDRRLGAETRRLREPRAVRGSGLGLGNKLPLELGQTALDELGRHEGTPARNVVAGPIAGS